MFTAASSSSPAAACRRPGAARAPSTRAARSPVIGRPPRTARRAGWRRSRLPRCRQQPARSGAPPSRRRYLRHRCPAARVRRDGREAPVARCPRGLAEGLRHGRSTEPRAEAEQRLERPKQHHVRTAPAPPSRASERQRARRAPPAGTLGGSPWSDRRSRGCRRRAGSRAEALDVLPVHRGEHVEAVLHAFDGWQRCASSAAASPRDLRAGRTRHEA